METPRHRKARRPARGLCSLIGWCFLSPLLPARPAHVHQDFAAAVEQALISGKENLLIFTGLGWEEWSRKLHDEILDQPEFHESVRQHFILTHIDLPETPRTATPLDEVESRSHQLARDFNLHIFPSIYLCTPDGRPYALLGHMEGGPDALVRAIHGKRTAHAETMRDIDTHEGPELARALDRWLQTIPEPLRPLHRDVVDRIIAADPDDVTGLRSKHRLALMLHEARQLRHSDKLDDAEALYLRIVKELKPSGETLQKIYYELGDVYFVRKDYDSLLNTLDLAIDAAPQGGRISVLREMMEAFTRQWILTRHMPAEMRAVNHDHKRVTLNAGDIDGLLKRIADAKRAAPHSSRNQVLDSMAGELISKRTRPGSRPVPERPGGR